MAAQSAKIEQHETGKPLHIKGLLRILIPPFPGYNPGAPASPRGLYAPVVYVSDNSSNNRQDVPNQHDSRDAHR